MNQDGSKVSFESYKHIEGKYKLLENRRLCIPEGGGKWISRTVQTTRSTSALDKMGEAHFSLLFPTKCDDKL